MDENKENLDFDLDEILNEFHDIFEEAEETAAEEPQLSEKDTPQPAPVKEEAKKEAAPAVGDTIRMEQIIREVQAELSGEEAQADPEVSTDATIRMEPAQVSAVETAVTENSTIRMDIPEVHEGQSAVTEDITIRMDIPEEEDDSLSTESVAEEPAETAAEPEPVRPPIIELNPRARLRELKKQLVAGPEKRYYELTEQGIGRLQMAILLNLLVVIGCAAVSILFTMGLIPENRLKLVIFTQILAMLLSALLGCHQMLDGLSELLRGRFTINTLLNITFIACAVDAVFCLKELRIPCCAAFSLHIAMALWARYQRRTTEMAQMDTMRKAVRLHSLVKEPDCYEGRPGILRGYGRVSDFMDNYNQPSGPEKVQNAYAFICLFACVGIAVFAGMLHGVSLGIQVFSTSLLVAVPASFFVSLTRPMAILERRLHMVGTVLCGWQGVKALCDKAVFPLKDEDIFPNGSTKLNGVKFYGDRDPDEVVSYTTSLICAAGGGLVNVFRQLLSSRDGVEHPVVNFRNYGDGGIGGEVCGEPVLLGNLDFLQDMGVEIPEGTMVNQAVYASIDGQLSAVFAISYAKMRSASAGLVSLSSSKKLIPVLTGGDFMLTDELLRSKFGVNTRRVAFPPREVRREIASRQADPEAVGMAFATRDELVSYAYAITGSRALRAASRLGVCIHLIGGILGMLIMLVLAYLGSTELLTPTHILLYQLVWMIPGLLITEWTRTV